MSDTPIYPDLDGSVCVVTGGSRGIGAATCAALGTNGARVAVCGRDREAITKVTGTVQRAGGEAIGVTGDVTDPEALERMRDRVQDELGPPDVLIPFAGGFGRRTPLPEIGLAEWRSVLDANLTSTFLTVQAFLPAMRAAGRGSIVTMASNAGRLLDMPLTASYAAAKAAVVMFSRHAALELGADGIRVNCIAPATVLTDRVEGVLDEDTRAGAAARSPLGRIGSPEDCANATLYLASDAAGWITGVTLDVAGGRIML